MSADGMNFIRALEVTNYKVTSPRAYKTDYVWDPTLNDYKKAPAGQDTEDQDLSLSGSGQKSPEDYPQYFVLPKGTQGRYIRITGTKLKDENRMQFMEVEVFGTLKQ
jgi:hypothetical protein